MKYLVLSILTITILFTGCKADDDSSTSTPDPVVEDPVFFPLALGNYWLYEVVKIDAEGNEEIQPEIDTVKIIGTRLINGEIYHIMYESSRFFGYSPTTSLVRDSSGFLVNSSGRILLSNTNFGEVLETIELEVDDIRIEFTMHGDIETVNVPLGDFDCQNFEGVLIEMNEIDSINKLINFYSNEVGLVKSNDLFLLYPAGRSTERRLIDFHLE